MIETTIENLKQEIKLIIDIGLDIEMKEVFKSFDNIKKFKINHRDDKSYLIFVEIEKIDRIIVDEIFIDFFNFLRYRYMNFYTRKFVEDKIIYKFISAKENIEGFYCEIIFSN